MQYHAGHPEMSTVTQRIGSGSGETVERPFVSVVIPCLNEADSIEECVRRSRAVLAENDFRGEVVVADNGSTDGSPELAERAGARVVREERRGYGSAYLAASTS